MVDRRDESGHVTFRHCFSRSLLLLFHHPFLSLSVFCCLYINKKSVFVPLTVNVLYVTWSSPAPSVLIHVYGNAFSVSSSAGETTVQHNAQKLLTRVSNEPDAKLNHSTLRTAATTVFKTSHFVFWHFRTNAIVELSRRHCGCRASVSKTICQHARSDTACSDVTAPLIHAHLNNRRHLCVHCTLVHSKMFQSFVNFALNKYQLSK